MKKVVAKVILWVLGTIAVLFLGLPYLMSWQLSSSHNDTWEAMTQKKLPCPQGTEETNRGWSKAGYMRYCEPYKHGPWEAWSGGYLQIKGEYKHGKEHGTWEWYNPDGSVQKTITYNSENQMVTQ